LGKKGTPLHRSLGKVYMVLMLFTALVSLFMPAVVGGRFLNHFGWIHLFSLLTLWSVPHAYFAIRKGDVRSHQISLVCLYLGAIGIAGAFTLAPGRFLHEVFFG